MQLSAFPAAQDFTRLIAEGLHEQANALLAGLCQDLADWVLESPPQTEERRDRMESVKTFLLSARRTVAKAQSQCAHHLKQAEIAQSYLGPNRRGSTTYEMEG